MSTTQYTTLSSDLTGWFQIGWSTDFPAGEVRSLRYFGEDLIAFRSADGRLSVLDAYCQHIGAHLGVGGCVTDTGVRCAFHGWVWDGDGRNVEIPYQDSPNRARRVRSWPTAERNGVVFVWASPQEEPPRWELPSTMAEVCPHLAGRSFHDLEREHFTALRIHPQLVIENAVDPAHFPAVHGTGAAPTVLHEDVDDFTWHSEIGFGAGWEGRRVGDRLRSASLTIHFSGIGTSWNTLIAGDVAAVVLVATTCVGDGEAELFETVWLEQIDGEDEPSRQMRLTAAMTPVTQDMAIWNSQRYIDPAGLATSEVRLFNKMRRWTQKFYPAVVEPVA